jgi:NTE family protein
MRHPWGSRAGLLCAALPVGRMDTAPYAAKLRLLTGDGWPQERLWIVAAKLPAGKRVVFGAPSCPACDVAEAVSASCAIPGIFAPVHIDGSTYVDGGVHSPTNADVVASERFDTIVVVSPMSASRPSLRAIRVSPPRMFFRALLAAEVRKLRASGATVIVIQPGAEEQRVMGLNGLDPSRCARAANAAREAMLARLDRPRLRRAAERLAA